MAFVGIGFGAGLRGKEVTLTSLKGMIQFWEETMNDKDDPYVMVTLYGWFKLETGFRWNCLPICDKNRSWIQFRKWIGRLMHTRVVREGKSGGWLFTRPNGTRAHMSDYNDEFVECIYALHENKPHLFSKSSLLHMFALRRSLRIRNHPGDQK